MSAQNISDSTILVVDDAKENLHLLLKMLDTCGYRARPTLNGYQALQLARVEPPDLILLDIQMPEIDGYEVCRQLKADRRTADIPIIFLSGMDRIQDKVKAFHVGGIDYITKPFHFEEVRARVNTQLLARAAQLEVKTLNATLEARVKERTHQLELANRERERAHASMLRMTQQLLQQRSDTIEQAYNAVHNGPLQELAVLLRGLGDRGDGEIELRDKLLKINSDLRGIYHAMREAALDRTEVLCLEDGHTVDLNAPLSNLLRQIFERTVERDLPGFTSIPFYITPDFTPLDNAILAIAHKRNICIFFQEALCNIGKHALGTTRIQVLCTSTTEGYQLEIGDNGCGLDNSVDLSSQVPPGKPTTVPEFSRQGTHQAETTAGQLGGIFSRVPNTPKGTICRLSWPNLS